MSGRDILVELDAYDIGGAVATKFYYGSRGYNHPSAPAFYKPRLLQPLNFRRDIFASATTGGVGRVSYGEMRLINNDGGLDALRDYGIIGRRVSMLIGDASGAYSAFEPLIFGRVRQPLFAFDDLAIQLRDRLEDFAQAVQQNKYLGNNVLPDGLEGTEDLKDRLKPRLIGSVQNITPTCCNTAKLIYQVNDGAIESLTAVYDSGARLTAGADYANQADMLANEPGAGTYRAWKAGGYFRIGSIPAGAITCDAADKSAAAANTAAQVALRIATVIPATGEGGVALGDVDTGDVAALDIANAAVVGIWMNAGETYAFGLDAVLGSIGAWYGFDRIGVFRMHRLELPSGSPVATFKEASLADPLAVGQHNIITYRPVPSNDPEKGQPSWSVSLDYSRNYTVQSAGSIAGVVDDARRNFMMLATRAAKAEDTVVQTAYPLAVEKTVATLLIDQAAAEAEAARLLDIFKEPHDFLEVDLPLTSGLIALVDIGAVVSVVLPRFDYAAGKLMRALGMQYNAAAGIVTLALWG